MGGLPVVKCLKGKICPKIPQLRAPHHKVNVYQSCRCLPVLEVKALKNPGWWCHQGTLSGDGPLWVNYWPTPAARQSGFLCECQASSCVSEKKKKKNQHVHLHYSPSVEHTTVCHSSIQLKDMLVQMHNLQLSRIISWDGLKNTPQRTLWKSKHPARWHRCRGLVIGRTGRVPGGPASIVWDQKTIIWQLSWKFIVSESSICLTNCRLCVTVDCRGHFFELVGSI